MKTGRSLTDLAAEIERQSKEKHDFVTPTTAMVAVPAETGIKLMLGDDREFGINANAHQNIAEHAGIPKPYYERMMREAPGLLATNINTWFARNKDRRLLRTLDGNARALLSDSYRPLDNFDLAEVALPTLMRANLDIVSAEVTESKLYIKAVDRSVQRHIPVGHKMGDGSHVGFKIPSGDVVPALQISNSEIGQGTLSVVAGMLDGGCTNLCWWWKDAGLRKYHIGGRHEIGDELYAMLTDETKNVTDKAVWMQFRDTLKAAIEPKAFETRIAKVATLIENKIDGDVPKVVEVTAKKFGLSDGQRGSVLKHLIEGADLSQFGLLQAITRAAEDQPDYDEATRMEGLGGRVVELTRSEWKELALAA